MARTFTGPFPKATAIYDQRNETEFRRQVEKAFIALTAQQTGWVAMTGTPDFSTVYDTASITLPQLAARVMAMQQALTNQGVVEK